VRIRDLTLTWLDRHGLRWDLLVMRAGGDFSPSPDMKRDAVRELRGAGLDLRLAFEDDRRNVDMFHAEGVPCIYLHSGYYEA
jgi:pyridoxine 5'-phosphate synthase PdxJ